jgi:hypothetical protein
MFSTFPRMPTAHVASTSRHHRLAFPDILRIILFSAIPLYTRFCVITSIPSVLGHTCIVGSISVNIVHFSGGVVTLDQVRCIVYALAMSSFPSWSKPYSLLAWVVPEVKGWRGAVIHWVFAMSSSTCPLPESHGRDIEVRSFQIVLHDVTAENIDHKPLREEYKYDYHLSVLALGLCLDSLSGMSSGWKKPDGLTLLSFGRS